MKRLIVGLMLSVVATAWFAPGAQAKPTLTMNEARMEIASYSYGGKYYGGIARNCDRLASNRIRCTVKSALESGKRIKLCSSRVEVVEHAEIHVRTLRRKCRQVKVPYLTWRRAERAAMKAMDPMATNPDYANGFGGGGLGKNRYIFEATWVTEQDQTCLQTARVRLVKKKVKVNVSEVACVDDPEWPTAGH